METNRISSKKGLCCTLSHTPPKRGLVFILWQSPLEIKIKLKWATQKYFHATFPALHTLSSQCLAGHSQGHAGATEAEFMFGGMFILYLISPAMKIQVQNAPWEKITLDYFRCVLFIMTLPNIIPDLLFAQCFLINGATQTRFTETTASTTLSVIKPNWSLSLFNWIICSDSQYDSYLMPNSAAWLNTVWHRQP